MQHAPMPYEMHQYHGFVFDMSDIVMYITDSDMKRYMINMRFLTSEII